MIITRLRSKVFSLEKNCVPKKFWVGKILGKKKFGIVKILCPKHVLGPKNLGFKKILSPKNFGSKFLVQNYFELEIIVGPKKLWVQKNCGSKKYQVKKCPMTLTTIF